MDNKQIAKEVIDALGGRENVNSVAHCATRLRVMVKDENKINKEKAENIEKVQGAFFNSGQYQIIFGTGTVNKIYDEVVAQGLPTASKDEQKAEAAKQGNWFQRAIRSFGDVFVPLLPAIVATGLFMGIRGAINNDTVLGLFGTTSKAFAATDFYTYTVVLTDTAFAFFPALICWSAFNVFGGSPLLGLVLGLMMVNNALPNAWDVASGAAKPIYFFDFIPVVGYQNSVLPAFFVGLLGAKFEQWVRKWVPDVLDLLLRPLIVFAVCQLWPSLLLVLSSILLKAMFLLLQNGFLTCHLVLLVLLLVVFTKLSSLQGFTTSSTCLKLTLLQILVKTHLTQSSQLL